MSNVIRLRSGSRVVRAGGETGVQSWCTVHTAKNAVRHCPIVFLGLAAALMFSFIPVMVKLVLGFQVAIGNAGQPVVAGLIRRECVIVFVLWALIGLGLMIAVPAAIIDGAFD
jgi:hypothetical protein